MVPLTRPGVNSGAGAGGGQARSAGGARYGDPAAGRRPPRAVSFGVMVVNGAGSRAVSNGVWRAAVGLLSIQDAGEPAHVHAQADRRSCARSRE
jgi:hypothetical protein